MKNKILKILENPKKVITSVFIVSVLIGLFVYKTNIHPTQSDINGLINQTASSTSLSQKIQDGDNLDLAFRKGGRVNKIYVANGDIVKKDQVLAELDSGDTKGILTQAQGLNSPLKVNQ